MPVAMWISTTIRRRQQLFFKLCLVAGRSFETLRRVAERIQSFFFGADGPTQFGVLTVRPPASPASGLSPSGIGYARLVGPLSCLLLM